MCQIAPHLNGAHRLVMDVRSGYIYTPAEKAIAPDVTHIIMSLYQRAK